MARRIFIWLGFGALLITGVAAATDLICPPLAWANACASGCYAAHNQCRMATKGSPACDAQLTSCLRGCNARR